MICDQSEIVVHVWHRIPGCGSRIVGACLAQLGDQVLLLLVVCCLSSPLRERQKAKADYKGGDKKDRQLLFLPSFSPMYDEVILLPTCWNWREDELVGHNARAGHWSPTLWSPREREAFCCFYVFSLRRV